MHTASEPAPSRARGTVTLIIGCMFAGKTRELLGRFLAYPADSRRAFKHCMDERYATDALVSHDGLRAPATRIARPEDLLSHLSPTTRCIALEEVHFFVATLPDVVEQVAARGVDVLLTGLDFDTWGNPMPMVEALRPLADEVLVKLASCVVCGRPADRSHRLTPIVNGNLVGGPESFEPRCQAHWQPPAEQWFDPAESRNA